ncbi:Threonylcarbamoyladenosine tRNA methylthiotransferase MtaB [bioreactor metagenome]|uniref:Threonylcarbamoyladenosine tRNA methylthiotransferase MtaB n=1 Tax=bioreactor metagenome TaxID=1076179 RepID=A0A645FRQ7_9ZZZZ
MLTGIHVASYGKELHNSNLLAVIEKIHPIEGIERIRFSSIEPNIVTEEFMAGLSQLKKVCHHFHLSLQSGCDRTLKAMNRKYTTEKYLQAVQTIRKYWDDAAITTDIIVGFPGETDEDFRESYDFAKKIAFSKIHVFPYSPKKGTPAEKMHCQIAPQLKAERSRILIELSDKMAQDFINKFINKEVEVLFEQGHKEKIFEGHTSNYINVTVESDENIKNKILRVKLINAQNEKAFGDIC